MTQIETWLPLAEQLRHTIPDSATQTTLNAIFEKNGSMSAWNLEPGERLNFREVSKSLDGLFGDVDAVCVQMTVRTDDTVTVDLVARRPEIDDAQIILKPGALPGYFETLPARFPVPYSPGMNPERTWQLLEHRGTITEPVAEDRIIALEKRLNVILPPDVRELFRVSGVGWVTLPETLVDPPAPQVPWDEWESDYVISVIKPEDINTGIHQPVRFPWFDGIVLTDDPKGRVQTLGNSPAWIPIADDGGGNFYIVDLAPGPQGYMGQILFHWHEESEKMFWFANSLTELLEKALAEGPLQGEEEAIGEARWNTDDGSRVRVSDRRPDALSLVNPTTQVLEVANDRQLDLEPLAGLPELRWLSLEDGARLAPGSGRFLKSFPKLEFLGLTAPDWQPLLDAPDLIPDLKRAAVTDPRTIGFFDRLHLSDTLLATRGFPIPTYFSTEGVIS
jgi:hypothetical protein